MAKTTRSATNHMDTILVSSGDQALATGALATSGNAVNIADGKLGVLSTDFTSTGSAANNFIAAGNTALQVKKIKVLRGTPNSTNLTNVSAYNLNDKAYLSSIDIDPSKVISVATTLPEIASYDVQYLSAFTAPTVGTDYTMNLVLESVTRDIEYAPQKRDWRSYTATTPATAPVSITDWLLQTIATKANQESIWRTGSGRPFIVFGINTGGAPGTVINNIASGTSIPFLTDNGQVYSYVADTAFVKSMQNAVAGALVGTESIVNLNSVAAGTAATVNALLVVGLDEPQAIIFDEETRNKVRINAGIEGATFTDTSLSDPKEWIGTGRQWFIEWKRRMGPTNYFSAWYPSPLAGGIESSKSYITNSETTLYTSTVITYNNVEQNTTSEAFTTPHRLVILLPAAIGNPATTVAVAYTVSTTEAATLAALNASLGAWLSSASTNFSNIEYEQAATLAAPFV